MEDYEKRMQRTQWIDSCRKTLADETKVTMYERVEKEREESIARELEELPENASDDKKLKVEQNAPRRYVESIDPEHKEIWFSVVLAKIRLPELLQEEAEEKVRGLHKAQQDAQSYKIFFGMAMFVIVMAILQSIFQ